MPTVISRTLAATHAHVSLEPCKVRAIMGNWNGAADVYLQVFDVSTNAARAKGAIPANGETPLGVINVYAKAPFFYSFPVDLVFNHSCVLVFSTTSATLTVVTGAGNTGDIVVEGEGFEATAITTESFQDTGVASSYGPLASEDAATIALTTKRRLVRVEVANGSVADAYLFMTTDTTSGPNYYTDVGILVAAGGSTTLEFGPEGRLLLNQYGAVYHNGLIIATSSSATAYVDTAVDTFTFLVTTR